MKHALLRIMLCLFAAAATARPANAQAAKPSPQQAQAMKEDSIAKQHLRMLVSELRDTLSHVQAVPERIQRARASRPPMNSVVSSLARELGRQCLMGVATIDQTTQKLRTGYLVTPAGEQALRNYGTALSTLREDLRLCAKYDSAVVAASGPLDAQRLENIAIAAGDAVTRYDQLRDGMLKELGLTLPIKGKIWTPGKP